MDGKETTTSVRGKLTKIRLKAAIKTQDKELEVSKNALERAGKWLSMESSNCPFRECNKEPDCDTMPKDRAKCWAEFFRELVKG